MLKPKIHTYRTELEWSGQRMGVLSCADKPNINVACPPEFGGHPGIWSPEDMFIGSIELCTMTTFLWLAGKHELEIGSYKSEAVGSASVVEGVMRFTEIVVRPVVELKDGADINKAGELFDRIGEYCLISNSLRPEVLIQPDVMVAVQPEAMMDH